MEKINQTDMPGIDRQTQATPCTMKHKHVLTDSLETKTCHMQTIEHYKKDRGSQCTPKSTYIHSSVQTPLLAYSSTTSQTDDPVLVKGDESASPGPRKPRTPEKEHHGETEEQRKERLIKAFWSFRGRKDRGKVT